MRKLLLIAMGLVTAMSMTAHADVFLPTEQDFMHCDPLASTPVGNANILVDNALGGIDTRPHWNTSAPTGPGCEIFVSAATEAGTNVQNIYGFMSAGQFVGNLDSLTVSLYAAIIGPALNGAKSTVYIHVTVDGLGMWGLNTSSLPAFTTVDVMPQPTATQGVYRFDFSVTGLGFTTDDSAPHDIEISANPASELAVIYPIDSTSAPTNVTFNPETLAAASVAAKTPGPA